MGTVQVFVWVLFCFGVVVFVLFSDSVRISHVCFDCVLSRSQGLRYGPGVTTVHPSSKPIAFVVAKLHRA